MLAALALVLLAPMEKLDRGAVAVATPEGVAISWRLLPEDPKDQALDV